ncbi:MAG: hypothetical protein IT261_03210 [Saprospiraceae bacterium]|nr:hypothetical protein [Saprospiraceae bacterium]
MSFTRQHFTAGQQASVACSFPWLIRSTESANHWQFAFICPGSVGTRSGQCEQPGSGVSSWPGGSTPGGKMPAQFFVSMKNARKTSGIAVSDKFEVANISPNDPVNHENPVFAQKPGPRPPDSPEVASLRALLKANLSRETAPKALLERIRNRIHDHRD